MKKKLQQTTQAILYGYKKYLLAMKLTALLCLINLLPITASVYSQNTIFSFNFQNTTVKEVLDQIEQQSQFRFFYNDKFSDLNRKVSLQVSKVKIEELLNNVLEASDVTYKILENNLIVITPKEGIQQQKVAGVITDANTNEPLIGVSVLVQGTTTGTVTDAAGAFSIMVPGPTSVLVVSYVGYTKKEIQVGTSVSLAIALTPEFLKLDEVIVVGYGVQMKSVSTGAIGTVDQSALQASSFTQATEAFEGKIPGLQAVPISGSPGSQINLRIRGYGSNGNSNPLYIVDGMITNDISNLDPADVASEEVLKDAASCAIYGSQAGNGVVMITTKKGEAGNSVVKYDFQYSWQTPGHYPSELNATDYINFMNEPNGFGASQSSVSGLGAFSPTYQGQAFNTNWMKAIFTNGFVQRHNLSFSRGNDKTNFYASFNYFTNNGIVEGDQDIFTRYNFRINADSKMKSWLKVGTNMDYTNILSRGINENGAEFGGVIASALQLDPSTPVEYPNKTIPAWLVTNLKNNNAIQSQLLTAPDGNFYGISDYVAGEIRNPLVTQALTNGAITTNRLQGDFYAELTPIKGFNFTSRVSLDYSYVSNHSWNPTFYYDATNQNSTTVVNETDDQYLQWMWENFASYNRKFNDHNLTVLVGISAQEQTHNQVSGNSSGMQLPLQNFSQFDYTNHLDPPGDKIYGYATDTKQQSYFGRLNYDYKGKYLLEGVIREDGAGESQVAPSGRWGTFPSVSAGWVLSQESFFPKQALSYAKIRVSWGQNGSITILQPNFSWAQLIQGSLGGQPITYPISNGQFLYGAEPSYNGNTNLTWETDQQTDIGLDLRAFGDRLTFTFDYWDKTTKNLLFNGAVPTPEASAYQISPINGGTVENQGLEFQLGYRNVVGNFHYDISINAAPLIKNNVTYINPLLGKWQNGAVIGTSYTATRFEPGHSVWHFYGFKTNGINKTTGDPIFINAAGQDVDAAHISNSDMQDIGSAIPKVTYGGSLKLSWKILDFTLNATGQNGNKIELGWYRTDKTTANRLTVMTNNHWSVSNPNGTTPAINANPYMFESDLMLYDGSFTRLQTIQLGVSLPNQLLKASQIKALRAYVSLDNWVTITKYPGVDPQPTIKNNASNGIGIDYGTFPKPRNFMLGVSLSF